MTVQPGVKLISSRRSYEFRTDDLRLTMLTTDVVQTWLAQTYHFQVTQVAQPAPMFGPVTPTYPPGLVCDIGMIEFPEQQITPIRMIHFEATRVIIDVAGDSAAIDVIWNQIAGFLDGEVAPDGSPIIGRPERVRDYSELTIPLESDLISLIPEPWLAILDKYADRSSEETFAPAFWFSRGQRTTIYSGTDENDSNQFRIATRKGSKPSDRLLYSGAPLTSDLHREYAEEFLNALVN